MSMTKEKCYKHLNLSIQPIYDISELDRLPDMGHVPLDKNLVNIELTDFMGARGISLKHVDVFCSPPGFELGIHVDGVQLNDNVAINWAYCEQQGSKMQWWTPNETKTKIVDPSKQQSAYGISTTPYALGWNKDEVDFLTEVEIRKPTLVNIGIPHSMFNNTKVKRKAISITWLYRGKTLVWSDAITLLSDIIVE